MQERHYLDDVMFDELMPTPPVRLVPLVWGEVIRPWQWPYRPGTSEKVMPILLLMLVSGLGAGIGITNLTGSWFFSLPFGLMGGTGLLITFALPLLVPTGFVPLSSTMVKWLEQTDEPLYWRALVRHSTSRKLGERMQRMWQIDKQMGLKLLETWVREGRQERLQDLTPRFCQMLIQDTRPRVRKIGIRIAGIIGPRTEKN